MSLATEELASVVESELSSPEMRELLARAMSEVLRDQIIAPSLTGAIPQEIRDVFAQSTPKLMQSPLQPEAVLELRLAFYIRPRLHAENAQSSSSTQALLESYSIAHTVIRLE